MKERKFKIFRIIVCVMLLVMLLPSNGAKAEIGTTQIKDFGDIVAIYVKGTNLHFENVKAKSNIEITIDGLTQTYESNNAGSYFKSLASLGITEIDDVQVKVISKSNNELNYTLKTFTLENDGVTIANTASTIQPGEYYTFYSNITDGNINPHRLNHSLEIQSGGVLYVKGGNQSGFAIGYGGNGSLTIKTGGVASINTGFQFDGAQRSVSISESQGSIVVDGGLYQTKAAYNSYGSSYETGKSSEGTLIIKNKGKADINATTDFYLGRSHKAVGTTTKGSIEVLSGNLNIKYRNMYFGYTSSNPGEVVGEIKLAKGQSMTINGISFSGYHHDLNDLAGLNRRENLSYVYYNWDGTNGYYDSSEETVTFDYGATLDYSEQYQASDFYDLDTEIIGSDSFAYKKLSASTNATVIKNHGYYLNDTMYESKKSVAVVPLTVQNKEKLENIQIDYGQTLSLPEKIEITLNNGKKLQVAIAWQDDLFNPNNPGIQEIAGKLLYPGYVSSNEDTKITVQVIVGEKPEAITPPHSEENPSIEEKPQVEETPNIVGAPSRPLPNTGVTDMTQWYVVGLISCIVLLGGILLIKKRKK